jgi:hypothetical protein
MPFLLLVLPLLFSSYYSFLVWWGVVTGCCFYCRTGMTVLLSQVPVLIVVFGVCMEYGCDRYHFITSTSIEDTKTARQRQRQQMRDSRFHQ